MAFPLATLIPMLAPKLVDIVGKIIPDPEAKAKAEYELLKMAQDGEFKAVEQQMSAILAEAVSSHPRNSVVDVWHWLSRVHWC